jgi:hypothetical protein
MNVDFGHTDPQLIVPYGGTLHLDGPSRRILVEHWPLVQVGDADVSRETIRPVFHVKPPGPGRAAATDKL